MEIPVVNRISHFQVTALPSPSTFPSPQTLSISGIEKVYSVWTWGALLLAVIASFGTIITRINFIIIQRLRHKSADQPLSVVEEDDFSDIDDDDDDAYSVSTASSDSDEEEEKEEEDERRDEDFNVLGSDKGQNRSLRLRRGRSFAALNLNRFSWSDFASGKSVVKLWDNLALGLDLDDDSNDEYSGSGRAVSVYDMNKQKKINSFAGSFQVPAAATSSCSTILTADTSSSGRVALGMWDTRVSSRIPAMLAEWSPRIGRIVGVSSGGVDKVYVKDDVTGGLMVGDVRKVGAPLRNVTDADVTDRWWDADAVMVSDECFDELAAANGCDSAVTRCCSAVKSYLL
ncbi:uncharacterized protein LOC126791970 [Argentina anserina]|uniref:uncharacterized protein LOC126791970 n=1 Tax=Argentina anserina TaxID=57926 RepID=UPI00217673F1|nr:uncharacterized protein LOC126791970 [Potentilla anserina]